MTFGPAVTTASAGGMNTYVQFNNAGSIDGSGNLTFNNTTNTLSTGNLVIVNNISSNGANVTGNLVVTGNITGTGNITRTGTITATGNITGNYFIGNGSQLTAVPSANSATYATTVTGATQANITSVGTLTSANIGGNLTLNSWLFVQQSAEIFTTKASVTGTVAYDLNTGATYYHTTPVANWTSNFTNVPAIDGRAVMITLLIVQGTTPYLSTTVQIEGVSQTVKWINGSPPVGNASKIDAVSFSLFRVGSSWTVLGQYGVYA